MKRFALGLAVLPFLAGAAAAGQPLTDKQMDTVTAGFKITLEEQTEYSTVLIDVNQTPTSCNGYCYLTVNAGFVSLQSAFGNVSSLIGTGGG